MRRLAKDGPEEKYLPAHLESKRPDPLDAAPDHQRLAMPFNYVDFDVKLSKKPHKFYRVCQP